MGLFDAIGDAVEAVDTVLDTAEDVKGVVDRIRGGGPAPQPVLTAPGSAGKPGRGGGRRRRGGGRGRRGRRRRRRNWGMGQMDPQNPGRVAVGLVGGGGVQPILAPGGGFEPVETTGSDVVDVITKIANVAVDTFDPYGAREIGTNIVKSYDSPRGGAMLNVPDLFCVALDAGLLQSQGPIRKGYTVPVVDAGGTEIGAFTAARAVPRKWLIWFNHPGGNLHPALFPGLKAYGNAGVYLERGVSSPCIVLGPKPKRRRKTLTPKRLARFRQLARMVESHDKLVKKTKRLCKMR